MAQQLINIGSTANDGTGDTWRDAFVKVNANETELFDRGVPADIIIINSLADFPDPVGQVITLLPEVQYIIGTDVNIGDNRLVMAQNTVLSGIDSIAVAFTYTGSGDMFTITNTRNRISRLSISCVNGRVINFSDNLDNFLRITDCSIACATFGLFNSTGTRGSSARFTNVSPSSMTSGGCTLTGNWNTWLYETGAGAVTVGEFFDFGTATFDAIVIDLILANLSSGTSLIKGAASSANINTGGSAIVTRTLISGAGTALDTVTTDDVRWIFSGNDDIKDTNPDGLLSLNGNATETTITTQDVPVLTAGTWVVESTSFFTGTTAGRLTYVGEKDLAVPVDIVATVISASGTNKDITVYLALNGSVIANSGKTNRVGATDPASVTALWQLTVSTNDYLEAWVENNTDTINLVVSDAVLRIR